MFFQSHWLLSHKTTVETIDNIERKWIPSQYLSSLIEKSISQARDQTSNTLF